MQSGLPGRLPNSRPIKFADGLGQPGNVVLLRLDVHFQAEVPHRFRGDRADGSGLQALRPRELEGEEILDGRGAGEGDEVGAFLTETRLGTTDIVGLGYGAV